jgi:hypothetical protein
MKNELLLLAGSDIPFVEARITIHQPTLKEIGYIGEENFFLGCGLLDFSKDLLDKKDKNNLENYNDFDILMSIMIKKDSATKKSVDAAILVLSLLFPLYAITVRENGIFLKSDNHETLIDKNNFAVFKKILVKMFGLNLGKDSAEKYNPKGDMAQRIADKLKARQEKLSKLKHSSNLNKSIAVLSRYASILAVGLNKDMNEIMHYTVYQLYDEFQRFQLKVQWDAYIQAKMAGAKDLEEVDNWMIDLRDQGQNKNKNKK